MRRRPLARRLWPCWRASSGLSVSWTDRGLAHGLRNINADPGYAQTTLVANPTSELLVDLYGADAGGHARTAIGMAALPLDLPVILAAEVELAA